MNFAPKKTFLVFDNFVKDPKLLLSESKELRYVTRPQNPALQVSEPSRFTRAFCRKFEMLVGKKVKWHKGAGNYRIVTMDSARNTECDTFIHSDYQSNIVALMYLNGPTQCHGGTGFYRHKKTQLEGFHDLKEVVKAGKRLKASIEELIKMVEADKQDSSKWELTDSVQMKSNRLIIYNSAIFHSHILDFAKVKKGSKRLTFACWGSTKW